MNVKLLTYTPSPDWVCATAAGMCTHKGPSIRHALEGHDPAKGGTYAAKGGYATTRVLRAAMKSGHTSVAEHAAFTFEIRGISRVTLQQLVRHRHASYSVESQRHVSIESLTERCVIPESFDRLGVDVRPLLAELQHTYELLMAAGVPMEDARYVLPEGACTNLVLTMNARELRHFFRLRCCNRAQWEIRALADAMLALCRQAAPVLFERCGAPCQCGEPCPEVRGCGHPRTADAVEVPDAGD